MQNNTSYPPNQSDFIIHQNDCFSTNRYNATVMLIQCDFDGTITEEDVSFALLDAFAQGDWRKLFQQYRDKKISVGGFNTRAFALVRASKNELLEVVRSETRVRPGLPELVGY